MRAANSDTRSWGRNELRWIKNSANFVSDITNLKTSPKIVDLNIKLSNRILNKLLGHAFPIKHVRGSVIVGLEGPFDDSIAFSSWSFELDFDETVALLGANFHELCNFCGTT